MRKTTMTMLAILMLTTAIAAAGEIAPGLQAQLDRLPEGEMLKVLVVLEDRVDVAALDRELRADKAGLDLRHRRVVTALRDKARETQTGLLDALSAKSNGRVRGYRPHWLINAVVVVADGATIREIAARPDVEYVEPDLRMELIEPVESAPAPAGKSVDDPVPDGIEAIRAHEVWYSLGFDGSGTLVAGLDTGVDGTHPALSGKWRGSGGAVPPQEAWFIPGSFGNPMFPSDEHGHGTHTMGTMVGSAPTDSVGVAPGAQWIASNAVYNYEDELDSGLIAAIEFFTDPDGDPLTSDDVPDVVNNSWGIEVPDTNGAYIECDSRYWDAIDNCEAAGVVMVFGAGNEGPDAGTLRMPADRATTATNTFAVGSVNRTAPFSVSGFSSRGPSACGGPYAVKPEVSAPGASIYSTWPGGYGFLSGTSMATPHVAGTVALMRQANPDADVTTIKEILMSTALDIEAPGEDGDSGWGVIDAYAAVLAVMEHTGTVTGVVSDQATGLPVEGVLVARVGGLETAVTGPDGVFSFLLPSGPHQFTAKIFGYDDGLVSVTVLDDVVVSGDVTLVQQSQATVDGTVTGPDGEVVPDAVIEIVDTPLPTAIADGSGYYTLQVPADAVNPYTFRVSGEGVGWDLVGALVAADLTLDIQLPPYTTEDFESNTLLEYPWYKTGDDHPVVGSWLTTNNAWEGSYAVRSPILPNYFASGLAVDYDCAAAGYVSFRHRVSSEEDGDFLEFRIDGDLIARWSGEQPWQEFRYHVAAGPHTFEWLYTKDGSYGAHEDAAFLDYVTFPLPAGPELSLDVTTIAATVPPAGTASVPVTFTNTGSAPMDYTASVLAVDGSKDAGLDGFGYVWRDSDEPDGPAYAWTDISGDGTAIATADNALSGPFALGFTMPYYGVDYTEVWISTNGFVSFLGDDHDYRNTPLPDAADPDGLLALLWDNLDPTQGGTIYYRADAIEGRFIVQFQDVARYYTATPHTFQAVLYENGDVEYRYAAVPEPQSATVGLENAAGDEGLLFSLNRPDYLHDGLAIRVEYPEPVDWAVATPAAGTIPAGGNAVVSVDFDAGALPDGVYLGELAVLTGDPFGPRTAIPVSLEVSILSDADPDTPSRLAFAGAAPNPFNPVTRLSFSLPHAGEATLKIYDVAGRLVDVLFEGELSAGAHELRWSGTDRRGRAVASGVFYARLEACGASVVRPLTLVR